MTDAKILDRMVTQVMRMMDNYRRDSPFRAPESKPDHQSRLLNNIADVLSQGEMSNLTKYRPAFVGTSSQQEKIIIFQREGTVDEYYIQIDYGDMVILSPGTKMVTWVDEAKSLFHLVMRSPEWSGSAIGSRQELMEVNRRRA